MSKEWNVFARWWWSKNVLVCEAVLHRKDRLNERVKQATHHKQEKGRPTLTMSAMMEGRQPASTTVDGDDESRAAIVVAKR